MPIESYADALPRPRAIGFDLAGTLFDHRGAALAAVDELLLAWGLVPSAEARTAWMAAEEIHFERWRAGRISFEEQRRERLRTVLPQWGMQPPVDGAALDALFDRYLEAYRGAWRPFADCVALLEHLRAAGFRLGVLTNGSQEQQLDKLRAIGLLHLFDVVCTSERIGAPKPDLRAFLTLAEELGVSPRECLFVGDNPTHDVSGAEAAGMQALLIDRYGEHADGLAAAIARRLADFR